MLRINQKLKNFILQKIDDDLKNKFLVPYRREFWILDLDSREWYLYGDSNGNIWFNQKLFEFYFKVLSMTPKDLNTLVKDWVEKRFSIRVINVQRRQNNINYVVDGILNSDNSVWDFNKRYGFSYQFVKRYKDLSKHEKFVTIENFAIF